MKILTQLSLLALTYLAIPLFASAQIAPSGIFREQPTPTPQPSADQTPVVATSATIETPRAVKPESQVAKAIPKARANTGRKQPIGARTVFKLRQMEREWQTYPHNNTTIQRMVADDFIGVTSRGKIITKKALLKGSNEKKANGSFFGGKMDVRLHGANVAVVVGTAKQSKKSWTSYRFTDTWMERDGNWQCIASQGKALPTSSDRAESAPAEFQTGSNLSRRPH